MYMKVKSNGKVNRRNDMIIESVMADLEAAASSRRERRRFRAKCYQLRALGIQIDALVKEAQKRLDSAQRERQETCGRTLRQCIEPAAMTMGPLMLHSIMQPLGHGIYKKAVGLK